MISKEQLKVGLRIRGLAFGRNGHTGTIIELVPEGTNSTIKWDSGGDHSIKWSLSNIINYAEIYIPDDLS